MLKINERKIRDFSDNFYPNIYDKKVFEQRVVCDDYCSRCNQEKEGQVLIVLNNEKICLDCINALYQMFIGK